MYCIQAFSQYAKIKVRQRPFLYIYPPDFNLVRVQMLNRRGDRGLGPGDPTASRRQRCGRRGRGRERLPGCSRLREEEPKCAESHRVCRLLRAPSPASRGANQRLEDGSVTCILQDSSPHQHGILPAENTPSARCVLPDPPVPSHRELCSEG